MILLAGSHLPARAEEPFTLARAVEILQQQARSANSSRARLTGALSKLMAVAEAYPELKADSSMAKLQEQLISTEDLIASGRQAYNNSCISFNIFRKQLPQVLFPSMFGFSKDAPLWEIEEDSMRESPDVKLD